MKNPSKNSWKSLSKNRQNPWQIKVKTPSEKTSQTGIIIQNPKVRKLIWKISWKLTECLLLTTPKGFLFTYDTEVYIIRMYWMDWKKKVIHVTEKSDSRELISSCNCAVRTFLLIYWKVVYKKDEKITQKCSTNHGDFLRVLKSVRCGLIPSTSSLEGPGQQFQ